MKIWDLFVDIIFPPKCAACGKLGRFLCPECQAKIIPIRTQACPFCNANTPSGRVCPRCQTKSALSGVTALGYFKDPILKKFIHDLKYQKLSALAPTAAGLAYQKVVEEKLSFSVVTFVPISKKRKAWRGFNQSEQIARNISTLSQKPLFLSLKKTKDTKTQVGLKKKERGKNLEGVFEVFNSEQIKGKKVLLVDDVITTGSTLNEVAGALKKAGAHSVWGLVLAKE